MCLTHTSKILCNAQYSNIMNKYLMVILILATHTITGMAQSSQVFTFNIGSQVDMNTNAQIEQKKIGNSVMEFMYNYTYLRDTTDITSGKTDRMILQVDYGFAKFSSYRTMQIDSLIRVSTADQVKANPQRYVGGETWSIYKNYPSGKYTITDRIATDWFLIEELAPMFEWSLTEDTKEILGYKCKSATCDFRGRKYIAYYTEDVPVADGPWKFSGLPGFIMEVFDEGKQYSFVCVGINSQPKRDITMPQVDYNKTSRVKFYQTKQRYDTNPMGYLETATGVKVNVTTPDGKPRTDLTSERKLTYDYIETDWKKY